MKEYFNFNRNFNFSAGLPFPRPKFYSQLTLTTKVLWICYTTLLHTLGVLLFISTTTLMIKGYADIRFFGPTFLSDVFIVQVTLKTVVYMVRSDTFSKTYNKLEITLRDNENNPFYDKSFDELFQNKYKWLKIFGIGKFGMETVSGVVLCSWSIGMSVIFDDADTRKLPSLGWFPYNAQQNPHYSLTTTFHFFCYTGLMHRNAAMDVLYLGIIVAQDIQLQYLAKLWHVYMKTDNTPSMVYLSHEHHERNGDYGSNSSRFRSSVESERFRKLVWWIKQHQTTLDTLKDFEEISSEILLLTYGSALLDLFLGGVLTMSTTLFSFSMGWMKQSQINKASRKN